MDDAQHHSGITLSDSEGILVQRATGDQVDQVDQVVAVLGPSRTVVRSPHVLRAKRPWGVNMTRYRW